MTKRTIGVLIVALFMVLATCGDALAGGGRGGHKSPSVTKSGDKKPKKDKTQHKKKRKHKRNHHQTSPP